MKFVPFEDRDLAHSDGKMMSHAEIEIRIDRLIRFSKASCGGDAYLNIEKEILILETVLGKRPANILTCGEHAMDVEWTIFGTRPKGFEE